VGKRRRNAITGILVDKLDRATMVKTCRAMGWEVLPDSTDEQLSVFIFMKLRTTPAPDDLLDCDNCGGSSSEKGFASCPYCKDDEPAPAVPAGQPQNKKEPASPKGVFGKAPKEEAPEPMTTPTEAAATKQTSLATTPKSAPVATVTPISNDLAKFKESDLDKAVAEVQKLKSDASEDMHRLGQKIAEIHDKQLWKLRTEDGKPRYKSIESFIHEELGMTPQNAYRLLDTSKAYTPEQVRSFGTTKLGLILQAPEKDRPALEKAMKDGASKRALEKEVRKANKGKKEVVRRNKEKPVKKGNAKVAGGKPSITVASILGTQTVVAYKKGAMEGDKKTWTRAKRVADLPTGILVMENDVVLTTTLVEHTDGTLKFRHYFARKEA